MYVVVSYDIRDDKRRTRIHKALKNFGDRIQYSVFECSLSKEQVVRLQRALEKIIEVDEHDSVRYYFLCDACLQRVERIGGILPREDGPVVL